MPFGPVLAKLRGEYQSEGGIEVTRVLRMSQTARLLRGAKEIGEKEGS